LNYVTDVHIVSVLHISRIIRCV